MLTLICIISMIISVTFFIYVAMDEELWKLFIAVIFLLIFFVSLGFFVEKADYEAMKLIESGVKFIHRPTDIYNIKLIQKRIEVDDGLDLVYWEIID